MVSPVSTRSFTEYWQLVLCFCFRCLRAAACSRGYGGAVPRYTTGGQVCKPWHWKNSQISLKIVDLLVPSLTNLNGRMGLRDLTRWWLTSGGWSCLEPRIKEISNSAISISTSRELKFPCFLEETLTYPNVVSYNIYINLWIVIFYVGPKPSRSNIGLGLKNYITLWFHRLVFKWSVHESVMPIRPIKVNKTGINT